MSMPYELHEQLSQLSTYDNEDQLYILFHELPYLTITQRPEWFQERYRIIYAYSELNWSQIAKKFEYRDFYIFQAAQVIFAHCAEIIDEWQTKPQFNLPIYAELIEEVYNLWNYYKQHYGDSDEEMDDLSNMLMDRCTMDESV